MYGCQGIYTLASVGPSLEEMLATATCLVYIPSRWLSQILSPMPKSKIDIPRLAQYFEDHADKVFALSDLEFLCSDYSDEWNLPHSMTLKPFIRVLLKNTKIR